MSEGGREGVREGVTNAILSGLYHRSVGIYPVMLCPVLD